MPRSNRPPAPDPLPRICDIDWSRAEYINSGAYGNVYRVAPGLVVKIGQISAREVERQRLFAAHGLAVPVYDARDDVRVPSELIRRFCPRHRWNPPRTRLHCKCDEPQRVLLMPEAKSAYEHRNLPNITRFIRRFLRTARILMPEFSWDDHEYNVGFYKNHYVAFDFFMFTDDLDRSFSQQ